MKKGIILLILLTACAPKIRIYTDYDRDYNIREFSTFQWAEQKEIESKTNPLYYNELNDKRIKKAVNEQLTNHGYNLVKENGDFVIHYHIITEEMSEVVLDPYNYHYGPSWPNPQANIYRYREGTLIIDLMDSKNEHLVWRGWATSALDQISKTEDVEPLIRSAVAGIFKRFPMHSTISNEKQNTTP